MLRNDSPLVKWVAGKVMSKSKWRPPDRKSVLSPQSPIPSETPTPPKPRRLITAWNTFVAIGAIGGTLGLMDKGWSFFVLNTEPEIRAPGLATDAFSLPFSIKNPSSVFAMYATQWFCRADDVNKGPVRVAGIEFTSGNKANIAPGATILAHCQILRIDFPKNNSVRQSTITAVVRYKTLQIIPRENSDFSFTWLPDAQPPHWEPGKVLE
jgi:hypothetical protein